MKNLNSQAGIVQISSGTFQIPRGFVLHCLLNDSLTRNELFYLIIAIQSADWNKGEYRYGFIRHSTDKISRIFGIPYKTINNNFNQLVKKGFLQKERFDKQEVFKIRNYEHFHKTGSYEKDHPKEQIIELISQNLTKESQISELNSQIRERNQIEQPHSFNVSFKVSNKVSNSLTDNKIHRTDSDYQRIYKEGNFTGLIPEDMKWLDEHYDSQGRYIP